ncbi:MAG: PIN domain-containing protein [Novosphingobium sp.]|nr:PIN domain-containing protein [Novosphingobium sp.]
MIRIALDSNVLAYFAQVRIDDADKPKIAAIAGILGKLKEQAELVAPVQALGELFVVLRRGGRSATEARAVIVEFSRSFMTAESLNAVLLSAADLAARYRFQFWDSTIIAASAQAGCSLLLSEDMQDGFAVDGLTIVNPFAAAPHRKLARLLA